MQFLKIKFQIRVNLKFNGVHKSKDEFCVNYELYISSKKREKFDEIILKIYVGM